MLVLADEFYKSERKPSAIEIFGLQFKTLFAFLFVGLRKLTFSDATSNTFGDCPVIDLLCMIISPNVTVLSPEIFRISYPGRPTAARIPVHMSSTWMNLRPARSDPTDNSALFLTESKRLSTADQLLGRGP